MNINAVLSRFRFMQGHAERLQGGMKLYVILFLLYFMSKLQLTSSKFASRISSTYVLANPTLRARTIIMLFPY